jgi:hypothetical protein
MCKKLKERDDCFHCGKKFTEKNIKTIDHFIPKHPVGWGSILNCVYACYKCNNALGHTKKEPPPGFKLYYIDATEMSRGKGYLVLTIKHEQLYTIGGVKFPQNLIPFLRKADSNEYLVLFRDS